MEMNGGQALIKALEMEGVEVMFGLPGGAILPVYDPIIDSPIRHILVRHEQGAGHMAEGYAHATGRPGVAMVTSGPAATNIVTPLCDAYMDSVPIVVITGQVGTASIGTDAFQECDTTGITRSVTKHNELVTRAEDIPRVDPRGVPHRHDGPARARARRHSQGHRRPEEPELAHGLVLADRPRAVRRPARLQADDQGPSAHDQGSGPLHPREQATGHLRRRRHPQGPGGRGPARAGRAHRHPRRHHADGPRRLPRRPPAVPRHARHARQLHRGHRDAERRSAHRPRQPLRRPGDRQGVDVRARRQDHPRRHRPGRARQGAPARRADRWRLPAGDRGDGEGGARPGRGRSPIATSGRAGSAGGRRSIRSPTSRPSRTAVRSSRSSSWSTCATPHPRTRSWCPASASTRCGRASTGASAIRTHGSTPAVSARWASRFPRPSAPRLGAPTAWCGPSTATGASR